MRGPLRGVGSQNRQGVVSSLARAQTGGGGEWDRQRVRPCAMEAPGCMEEVLAGDTSMAPRALQELAVSSYMNVVS